MKATKKVLGAVSAGAVAVSLLASPALALDSSFEAMSERGKHRFYVWCTGRDDYVRSQSGSNAQSAQSALARQSGSNCWPVWQGKE